MGVRIFTSSQETAISFGKLLIGLLIRMGSASTDREGSSVFERSLEKMKITVPQYLSH